MTNFTRDSNDRGMQPAAIVRVDPPTRKAWGKTGYGTILEINCSYAVGETWIIPAVGEQWFIERFNMEWRLYGRIPFNDPNLNIEPVEGQVSVGSAYGPLVLTGTQVKLPAEFFIGTTKYRDNNGVLERQEGENWAPVIGGNTTPIHFSAPIAVTGVTASDEAYSFRKLTQAKMRVSSSPIGSGLTVVIQHWDGFSWNDIGTLTVDDGSVLESSIELDQEQITGNLVRLNVTSVGSNTAATGVVVDILVG